MTYLLEIPLAKIRDEISSLEHGATADNQEVFAMGAIAALVWLLDRQAPSPFSAMMAMQPRQETIQ